MAAIVLQISPIRCESLRCIDADGGEDDDNGPEE